MFANFRTALTLCALSLCVTPLHAASDDPLLGKWRILDSKSGVIESILDMRRDADGSYSGYVIKSSPNPLIKLYETCVKCPAPFTDQPIVGMRVVWGMKPDPANGLRFKDGYAFDPKNGKTYRGQIRVSGDERRMMLRGYIGTPLIGRTEVWLRGDGDLTKRLDSN